MTVKTAQKWAEMPQKWSENSPKMGSKRPENEFKPMPKWSPSDPKTMPKWSPSEPKMTPDRPKNGPNSAQKDQISPYFGPILTPFSGSKKAEDDEKGVNSHQKRFKSQLDLHRSA